MCMLKGVSWLTCILSLMPRKWPCSTTFQRRALLPYKSTWQTGEKYCYELIPISNFAFYHLVLLRTTTVPAKGQKRHRSFRLVEETGGPAPISTQLLECLERLTQSGMRIIPRPTICRSRLWSCHFWDLRGFEVTLALTVFETIVFLEQDSRMSNIRSGIGSDLQYHHFKLH